MNLNLADLNLIAVLIGIVSNMVLGALWYSPILFGNIWLKLMGKSSDDISKGNSNKSMSFAIIPAILMIFTLAITLLFIGAETILQGMLVASIMSIGYIGTSSFNLVLFEGRGVKITLIHLGYAFVSLNIASIILTLM